MPDNPNSKKKIGEPAARSSSTASISGSLSPSLKPKASSKLKRKSRPHLKRLPSGPNKLVFSVDDDINDDITDDDIADDTIKSKQDREYFEGYNDALKALYMKKSKKELGQPQGPQPQGQGQGSQPGTTQGTPRQPHPGSPGSYFPDISKVDEIDDSIDYNIKKHLLSAEENLKALENLDGENTPLNVVNTPLIEEDEDTQANNTQSIHLGADDDDEIIENEDGQSVHSSSSSQTIESLNLRERQDAINSTHPFGIKIWKPSLYKKKRSVAARAEEDIHDYNEHRPTGIHWGVYVTNFLWTISVGLLLFTICTFCSISLFILTGFGFKKNSRHYVKFLFKLAKYWLYPFGRFVILNKDDNYLNEDDIYGSSIGEFHRWRNEDEGRLFFAPPRRYTNSNNESRPLIKDHKGRALRDTYTFLNDNEETENPSNSTGSGNGNGHDENLSVVDEVEDNDNARYDIKVRFFGRGTWTWSRVIFYILFYGIMQPVFYIVGALCWLIVFTIPMTNVVTLLSSHIKRHPLALHFESEKAYYTAKGSEQRRRKNQSILLCTYRCSGFHYYKYTLDGTNVFFINLLLAVVFVITDFYVFRERFEWEMFITKPAFVFCACLFSTIPLAFFIGQAVASISAQSSMGVGAVINAFFSTIVEIFLYCIALGQKKSKIVEGGMIGSILAGVLLLPGLSMCAGAFKRKTQRYNPRSAGVSSTMLLFGMVTMFAPSLFYQIYGSYEIKCKKCEFSLMEEFSDDCTKCRFIQPAFALDGLYYNVIRPFSLIVAVALLLAYCCGLLFTLRTHASLIWATNSTDHHPTSHNRRDDNMSLRSPSIVSLDAKKQSKSILPTSSIPALGSSDRRTNNNSLTNSGLPSPSLEVAKQRNPKISLQNLNKVVGKQQNQETTTPVKKSSIKDEHEEEGEAGGHDAPNWSRPKSYIILLSATLLYAVIAEILVDVVDDVLKDYPINPKFLGLTVFALVPNTTEFLNAISFALNGNVALSMEIGSAYALQVVLIQIPALAIYSIGKAFKDPLQIFSLVFPRWDIIATLISIYLFTYIYAEGKSNYFKGVILCLIYGVVLVGFWLTDTIESLDDGYDTAPINPPYHLQNFI